MAISKSAYIAPNATVFGCVFIAQDTYVGFGSVINAFDRPVRIGRNTKIGDNTTL